jgi:hypothetical protein
MNKIKEKGLMADKFFSGKIYETPRSCTINSTNPEKST